MWGYYTTFTSAMVVGGCMKVSLILVSTATMMYVVVCTPVLVQMMFTLLQKINARNAFGLHLIDYMLEVLRKRGEMTNFQVSHVSV